MVLVLVFFASNIFLPLPMSTISWGDWDCIPYHLHFSLSSLREHTSSVIISHMSFSPTYKAMRWEIDEKQCFFSNNRRDIITLWRVIHQRLWKQYPHGDSIFLIGTILSLAKWPRLISISWENSILHSQWDQHPYKCNPYPVPYNETIPLCRQERYSC